MQYLGGKTKLGKYLGKIINKELNGERNYIEPFVGGFNIIPHIYTRGDICASDSHIALINMYKALQTGWIPPIEVSEAEYAAAKRLPDSDPRKAFIGFACSFGGKYFGGYARGASESYADNAVQTLASKLYHIKRASFKAIGYNYLDIPAGSVIYCDPPYAGTTGYGGKFPSNHFWKWAKKQASHSTVLVSEYTCPVEHEILFEKKQTGSVRKNENNYAIERLFKV